MDKDAEHEMNQLTTSFDNLLTIVEGQTSVPDMLRVTETAMASLLASIADKKMYITYDKDGNGVDLASRMNNEKKDEKFSRKETKILTALLQDFIAVSLPALSETLSEPDVSKFGLEVFPTFEDLDIMLEEKRAILDAALIAKEVIESDLAEKQTLLITHSLTYD